MAARTQSTPYAILGMLSLMPMSGYDIRKESATSIGYFWSESYGQIYPTLRRLASQGLVRRRTERRAGRPDRQIYEITERGSEMLRGWLVEEPRTAPPRNELLLKLFFADATSVDRDIEWVEQLLAEERDHLREFGAIRQQVMKEHRHHPSLRFWLITLSFGEHRSKAVIRWCRETLNTLRPTGAGTSPAKVRAGKGAK